MNKYNKFGTEFYHELSDLPSDRKSIEDEYEQIDSSTIDIVPIKKRCPH